MKLDKLSQGERIAAVSAIVLFVLMFFDWFNVEVSTGLLNKLSLFAAEETSAWDSLQWIRIVLVIAILTPLCIASLRVTEAPFKSPIPANSIVTILGGLSFLLILYRIVDPPSAGSGPGFTVDVSPTFWIFAGLVAAAGIAYGGYRAMGEESSSFGKIADQLGADRRGSPPAKRR